MKAIEVSEVSALAPHVQPGCSEPLLLTDRGRVVATIVPAGEEDVESMLLSINPNFGAILERSRIRLGSEGGLSSEQVRERWHEHSRRPHTARRAQILVYSARFSGRKRRALPLELVARLPSLKTPFVLLQCWFRMPSSARHGRFMAPA
jgi:antitoxin (DNA-binding transcriptional repressor) of toxin-antitoxin stability system